MGSRSTHLRTKVVALLVSLVALWTFAAWVTLRDGLNLLWVQTYDSHIYQPSEPLMLELQRERRLSVVYLAERDDEQRKALESTRDRSRSLAAEFTEQARSTRARLASGDELEQRVDEVITGLDGLARTRHSIDIGATDRASTAQAYTSVLDSLFQLYDSLGQVDQPQIAKDTATLVDLNRMRELLAQEDALLAGAISAGRMNLGEYTRFAHLVGARRFAAAEAVAQLPDGDRDRYQRMAGGAAFTQLQALEDGVLQTGRPGTDLPVDAATWQGSVEPAMAELLEVVKHGGEDVVKRSTPFAAGVFVRLLLAAGLGLIAVIASIIVSVTTARALVQHLERLREAAWQLANDRLPGVVTRLGHGEKVDVAAEAPPLEFGNDEIGQVGKAFNAVQETAVRTAVEQAELRRAVRDIFLSLARRTQALLHRQLTLLDGMERRETDPEDLEALFRVDHLATRMRRNAENLIVLSGATAGRTWRRSVPMIDVIRGAVAEVEDYTRVTVLPVGPEGLAGRAVGDVIHLLAELIENALSFSPPHTSVQVGGDMVANGYVIEIEDRGLGMTEEDRAAVNERIASHPEFRLTDGAAQLGLYVVSRLTERHGVRVQLKESPYGGTTAVVLVPLNLVTEEPTVDPVAAQLSTRPAVAAAIAAGRSGAETRRSAISLPNARPVAVADSPAAAPAPGIPATMPMLGMAGSVPGMIGSAPGAQTAAARRPGDAPAGTPPANRVRPPAGLSAAGPAVAGPSSTGSPAASSPVASSTGSPAAEPAADAHCWNSPTVSVPQPRRTPEAMGPASIGAAPGAPGTIAPNTAPQATTANHTTATHTTAAHTIGTQSVPGQRGPAPAAGPTGSGGGPDATAAGLAAPAPAMTRTPSGLPVRVRRPATPQPHRDEPTMNEDTTQTDLPRAPEQVRRMVSSYQSGSRRGRSDAARLVETDADPQGGPDGHPGAPPDGPPGSSD